MITRVTRLDMCKGKCPKKGLPSGETICCFCRHEAQDLCYPKQIAFLDGRGYDRFYPYPELTPSTVVSEAVPVDLSETRTVELPIAHPYGSTNLSS
jgi:hypothetical protein